MSRHLRGLIAGRVVGGDLLKMMWMTIITRISMSVMMVMMICNNDVDGDLLKVLFTASTAALYKGENVLDWAS